MPTAYPSRRVWLHVTLRDANGRVVFESGALNRNGAIAGNDNDEDGARIEPHYSEINSAGQVQIYESVMGDSAGQPTTGLLRAVRFRKDNRLLPHGFDKRTAGPDIAVVGEALADSDFAAGGDAVRYSMATGGAPGPFQLEVQLWYQPIAFRWAMNLKPYNAAEPSASSATTRAWPRGPAWSSRAPLSLCARNRVVPARCESGVNPCVV